LRISPEDLFLSSGTQPDSITSFAFNNTEQKSELLLRQNVAEKVYADHLKEISQHHSIEVMDFEVDRFLRGLPKNAKIIDVGGCWAWHWRKIDIQRPDVQVVVVDFVRENLLQAHKLVEKLLNKQIFLVHADATDLPFKDNSFEAYWSVQTLQHIPNFNNACTEAHRVLAPAGVFRNYSLNRQFFHQLIYRVLGRKYHSQGIFRDQFYMERARLEQQEILSNIFANEITSEFSEILFHPDLRWTQAGRLGSWLGKLDARLTGRWQGLKAVARQQMFSTRKMI
jgi:ubiquinone/menaquinone biosynthesis C-methylase UbiE